MFNDDDFIFEYKENALENINPSNAADLKEESKDLVAQIIAEKDPDKLKDLSALFDMNQRKKNIARMDKLANLLEMVDDEVLVRWATEPDSFDNDQILSYMTSTQSQINNIKSSMEKTPLVQINSQKIEINNNSGLDQDSRKRVQEVVMAILNGGLNVEDLESEEE